MMKIFHPSTLLRAGTVLGIGWLFALGLGLSGMTDVGKVIGFLNLRGDWDPSLMGVMGGAIAVYSLSLYLIKRLREEPIHDELFRIPTRRDIDARLIVGAALFGTGWGIAGICPGPGLTSLVAGAQGAVVFVAAMLLGMLAHQRVKDWSIGPDRGDIAPIRFARAAQATLERELDKADHERSEDAMAE